jgi:hypothetical protein
MKTSVQYTNNDIYKITITSNTDEEKKFLESPFSEIKDRLYQYFDTAVKKKLGEKADIEYYVNDSNLPYEVLAMVSIKTNNIFGLSC